MSFCPVSTHCIRCNEVIQAYSNYAERCKVKYFFMGISFMVIVWAGTFALMI